ncbi:hypothetical protein C8F01DRAFT_1111831 [Mycena amicta]|nr:hypothetical protein C8F01DRAFT_1111831 [Mycena amicta]
MLVSRRWHDVSTANSSLWTDVHLESWKSDLWRLRMAHRYSRQRVRFLAVDNVDSFLALDAQHRLLFGDVAKSLVSLEMKGYAGTMKPLLLLMTKMDFPALQSVTLQSTANGARDDAEWPTSDAPLQCMPSLHSVSLRWITTGHWNRLHALQRLELWSCYPLTPLALLNVLKTSPQLRSLTLDSTISTIWGDPLPPLPTVHLPLLEELSVCEEPDMVDAVLGSLSPPAYRCQPHISASPFRTSNSYYKSPGNTSAPLAAFRATSFVSSSDHGGKQQTRIPSNSCRAFLSPASSRSASYRCQCTTSPISFPSSSRRSSTSLLSRLSAHWPYPNIASTRRQISTGRASFQIYLRQNISSCIPGTAPQNY